MYVCISGVVYLGEGFDY